jgi:hypothetical protein
MENGKDGIKTPSSIGRLLHLSVEQRLQQVPMTMRFVLGAMAQQRHGLFLGKMLQEAQGKFLAVVLNSFIALIDRSAFAQFLAIPIVELRPADFSGNKFIPELFTWSQVGHPDIVTILWDAPAQAARRENAKAVVAPLDVGMNGLGFEHKVRSRWL